MGGFNLVPKPGKKPWEQEPMPGNEVGEGYLFFRQKKRAGKPLKAARAALAFLYLLG